MLEVGAEAGGSAFGVCGDGGVVVVVLEVVVDVEEVVEVLEDVVELEEVGAGFPPEPSGVSGTFGWAPGSALEVTGVGGVCATAGGVAATRAIAATRAEMSARRVPPLLRL